MTKRIFQSHTLLIGSALVAAGVATNSVAEDAPFAIRKGKELAAPLAGAAANDASYAIDKSVLTQSDVQIRSDNLQVEPQLNITTAGNVTTAARSHALSFHPLWNYGAFIERAEVRMFAAGDSVRSEPVAIVPVEQGVARLASAADLPKEVSYVLRVYDSNGRFDETQAKFLSFVDSVPGTDTTNSDTTLLQGYGIDRTARRNIKVRGTNITISGHDIPAGGHVWVMGEATPLDANGGFQRKIILPHGDHNVDISILAAGETLNIQRDVFLDDSDFFYVSLGEVTLGTNGCAGPAELQASNDEDFDDVSIYGRGAMYASGRVKGDYRVTAAIDTGEDELKNLFDNIDEKDPRQLLRRLDGDRFYPVYGDDSQIVDDAPTQGKFYVRVEHNDSHIMWGNYTTQITGTELAHLDRGLYGGIANYKSEALTPAGDRRTHVTVFAADPGTLPAREDFRGTGGSLYVLQRQDLSIGSERVRVEVRDKVSGLVVSSNDLRAQEDYDIDYIQGRVLLSKPLQSYVNDHEVVRTSSLSGDEAYLVVRYEYTPALSDVDGYTVGGRGTQWLSNNVRVGVTAQNETTELADQQLLGTDLLWRQSHNTYVQAEFAQTEGPGFGQSNSVDGGFNFNTIASPGAQNIKAEAYRVEGSLGLGEGSGHDGQLTAYYDHQDDGFSGAGRLIGGDIDRWGSAVHSAVGERGRFKLEYDEVDGTQIGRTRAVYSDFTQAVSDKLSLSLGVRHDDSELTAIGDLPAVDGARTDATLLATVQLSERTQLHGFTQATLDRDGTRERNDRYGLGADVRLSDRLTVNGEVSDGDLGFGALTSATWQRSDDSEFYLGYALSPDNRTTGLNTLASNHDGTLTVGGRQRFGDSLSVFGEERYGYGRGQTSMTHAYGLNFNPTAAWSFGATIEHGDIEERLSGEKFERTAFTLSAGHANQRWRIASNLEGRFEDSDGGTLNRDRTTWLMRNTMAFDANKNWELLGRFNIAISDSDQSDFLDADFIEGVVGAAYRPVASDRLNTLIKYTYFEDLAPLEQVAVGGTIASPRQKSQIFSVDAIYDLTKRLSVGGKYGFRSGEVALDRNTEQFIKSDAHLVVARMDYHVVNGWDVLGEMRWLASDLADDTRTGALFGIYHHISQHAKIGVGYNFASFSDDLTNYDDDGEGAFINLVGKF